MPALAGFGGVVTLNGLTVGVKSWIHNKVNEALETTALADGQDREFISGLNSFTGAMEGNWDAANTLAVGDIGAGTFQLGNSGDFAYIASVIITGVDNEDAFDGVINAPITFQGTGVQPSLSSSSSSSSG